MGPSGQGLKGSGLEPAPASPQQVTALSPGQVPKESVPKESCPTPSISPPHAHHPASATQVSGEGIAVRKSLRASARYLHPRAPTPTNLIFLQVSIELQGLLQGLGHHLLPPAQEGSFLRTQIKAQMYGQLLGAGAV